MRVASNDELRRAGMAALVAGDHLTAAALSLISLLPVQGVPDCERCAYRAESWRDGGHCYMFRECPDTCGQFRSAPSQPVFQQNFADKAQ